MKNNATLASAPLSVKLKLIAKELIKKTRHHYYTNEAVKKRIKALKS